MDLAKIKFYWDKALALLRVRAVLSGLEISDTVLRLAYFDGQKWEMGAVRLEASVMEAGRVRNYGAFVSALKELKTKVFGAQEKKRINVIASLSSINIYSQVFSLPIIEGENLEKAIQLNVQMVSPIEASQAYSGWQLVGEDKDSLRLEILSAFIERSAVDEISKALYEAGFLIVALESRALALARIFREVGEGIDEAQAYIVISIDNSGIDFLIIRKGQLYFEYFNPWRDVADENGQVSTDIFRATVLRNMHQVMNFYGQHWPEPISAVFLSATALGGDVASIVKENFSLLVRDMVLRGEQAIDPEWFIALGCSMRGRKPRSEDKELSLLGLTATEEFHRERLLEFARFWRLAMPLALGLLLVLSFLSDIYLIQSKRALESQSLFQLSAEQAKENQTLQVQAAEFNKIVAMIKSVRDGYFPRGVFLEKIGKLASANNISISRMTFQSPDQPIALSGIARANEGIVAFKKALEGDPEFFSVDLPLTGIQATGDGFSFSVSFSLRR